MILYTIASSVYAMVGMAHHYYNGNHLYPDGSPHVFSSISSAFAEYISTRPYPIIISAYGLAALGFVGWLTLFHVNLLAHNITTVEQIRGTYGASTGSNPFSRGPLLNFLALCCPPPRVDYSETGMTIGAGGVDDVETYLYNKYTAPKAQQLKHKRDIEKQHQTRISYKDVGEYVHVTSHHTQKQPRLLHQYKAQSTTTTTIPTPPGEEDLSTAELRPCSTGLGPAEGHTDHHHHCTQQHHGVAGMGEGVVCNLDDPNHNQEHPSPTEHDDITLAPSPMLFYFHSGLAPPTITDKLRKHIRREEVKRQRQLRNIQTLLSVDLSIDILMVLTPISPLDTSMEQPETAQTNTHTRHARSHGQTTHNHDERTSLIPGPRSVVDASICVPPEQYGKLVRQQQWEYDMLTRPDMVEQQRLWLQYHLQERYAQFIYQRVKDEKSGTPLLQANKIKETHINEWLRELETDLETQIQEQYDICFNLSRIQAKRQHHQQQVMAQQTRSPQSYPHMHQQQYDRENPSPVILDNDGVRRLPLYTIRFDLQHADVQNVSNANDAELMAKGVLFISSWD